MRAERTLCLIAVTLLTRTAAAQPCDRTSCKKTDPHDKRGCCLPAPTPSPRLRPLDRDRDGVSDRIDRCPDASEDRDGHEDSDGCPDLNNDGDNILDADDRCRDEPEDMDSFEDEDGCPEPGTPPPPKPPTEDEGNNNTTRTKSTITPSSAPAEPTRVRVANTIYAGGVGFVTIGAYGGGLGVSYGLSARWDIHGSFLFGSVFDKPTYSNSEVPVSFRIARIRATRHYPRESRIGPFLGGSLILQHFIINNGSATAPGVAIEPGVILALSSKIRLVVALPLGVLTTQQICFQASTNTECVQTAPIFGGISIDVQFGGQI